MFLPKVETVIGSLLWKWEQSRTRSVRWKMIRMESIEVTSVACLTIESTDNNLVSI